MARACSELLAFFLCRYAPTTSGGSARSAHLHALFVLVLAGHAGRRACDPVDRRTDLDRARPAVRCAREPLYLVPLGAGAILVALLANGRIATVYAGFTAVLFGARHRLGRVRHDVGAARPVRRDLRRLDLPRARRAAARRPGRRRRSEPSPRWRSTRCAAAPSRCPRRCTGRRWPSSGGAVGVGLLVSFALPLLEGLFSVLTDIRLLELSNVEQPAAVAARASRPPARTTTAWSSGRWPRRRRKAIGANSLFCRVAAFYHDVGKIREAGVLRREPARREPARSRCTRRCRR